MTLSDLLTIAGIILAVIALIKERYRKPILLRFKRKDWYELIGFIIILHYLLAFEWLLDKMSFLNIFVFSFCPPASTWAYLLMILILIWVYRKAFQMPFPIENSEKLLKFYESELQKKHYLNLADVIEKYHKNSIIEYIKSSQQEESNIIPSYQDSKSKPENRKICNRDNIYGNKLLYRIIYNTDFIEYIAQNNPVFFTDLIDYMSFKHHGNKEFINAFLNALVTCKNELFVKELRATYRENNIPKVLQEKKYLILSSLFRNMDVAENNEVWTGVANAALIDMENEATKESSPLRQMNVELDSDYLWNFPIQIAIAFFHIMIMQKLFVGIKHHMWLQNYRYLTIAILKNIKNKEDYDPTAETPSRNHKLLETIQKNMKTWIETITDQEKCKNSEDMYLVIVECIVNCIGHIATNDSLSEASKAHLVNIPWECIIKLNNGDGDTALEDKIADKFIELLAKKKELTGHVNRHDEFLAIMHSIFEKGDDPSFDGIAKTRRVNFGKKVLNLTHASPHH